MGINLNFIIIYFLSWLHWGNGPRKQAERQPRGSVRILQPIDESILLDWDGKLSNTWKSNKLVKSVVDLNG